MTWKGIVINYDKLYRKKLKLDSRIHIKIRVIKMTLESLTMSNCIRLDSEDDINMVQCISNKKENSSLEVFTLNE